MEFINLGRATLKRIIPMVQLFNDLMFRGFGYCNAYTCVGLDHRWLLQLVKAAHDTYNSDTNILSELFRIHEYSNQVITIAVKVETYARKDLSDLHLKYKSLDPYFVFETGENITPMHEWYVYPEEEMAHKEALCQNQQNFLYLLRRLQLDIVISNAVKHHLTGYGPKYTVAQK